VLADELEEALADIAGPEHGAVLAGTDVIALDIGVAEEHAVLLLPMTTEPR